MNHHQRRREQRKNGVKKRYSGHHLRPSSRGGGAGENIVPKPSLIHEAWHIVFQNAWAHEVSEIVNEWTDRKHVYHGFKKHPKLEEVLALARSYGILLE